MKHRFLSGILYSIVIFSTVFFISCNNKKEEPIVFDDSHPLALAPDVKWAVIVDPYASFKKEIGFNTDGLGHCRKGDILQVLGTSQDIENNTWYFFEEGWLPAECLNVYNNRYKALTVSKEFSK